MTILTVLYIFIILKSWISHFQAVKKSSKLVMPCIPRTYARRPDFGAHTLHMIFE